MKATVLFPGKDWDDKFNPGKKKTQAKLELENGEEVRVNASNPDSPKAMFLKGLRRGDAVILTQETYHKKTESGHEAIKYWDIDTWELIAALQSGGVDADGKEGEGAALRATVERTKRYLKGGLGVAKEAAAEAGLEPTDDALFEVGQKIGSAMNMDMIHKGFKQ